MAPPPPYFNFPPECYRMNEKHPTFILPGVVWGTFYMSRRQAEVIQVVKIVLSGKRYQYMFHGDMLTDAQAPYKPASVLASLLSVWCRCILSTNV